MNEFHKLNSILKLEYQTTIDLLGSKFLDFDLKWNYTNRTYILSMLNYVSNLIKKLNFHKKPTLTHSLLPFIPPSYAKV